jgi:2-succinyl-5-enolpyruvyl-6-hydroxy-3-cyclohexene-1-carboxylate synthase
VQQDERLAHPDILPSDDQHLLLRAFVDELVRCGVTDVCTSPGSRSTPLVAALVRDGRLRATSHLDERSAGFFALGAARASGRPVALACTSGTAAANYLPAVVEAHEAGVPLLVLTADRPPELRAVGAGQAIDQIGLYGRAVRWFVEVGNHEATPTRVRWMRMLACRAVAATRSGRPGPVHLNFPLREPLVPPAELGPDPAPGRADGAPWIALGVEPAGDPRALEQALAGARRGVVVAGTVHDRETGAAVARAAAAAGWPVLADPLSGARRGPASVAHYDAMLRADGFTAAHRPDAVLRVGDLPTSKPLRAWLAGLVDVRQVAFAPPSVWADPDATVGELLRGAAGATLAAAELPPCEDGWLGRWRDADERVAAAFDGVLGGELSEPQVARALVAQLPTEATLVVASSMPVRDVESFAPARDEPPRVLSNRGANGIDGTVSTAFGVASATAGPVVALLGDVALLHDVGGLLAARRLGLPMVLVVLNNDGGGIFEFLPVAGESDFFEEHVATPHGVDFAHAAALYGCALERPTDLPALRDAVAGGLWRDGATIVEVRTNRDENLALHRRAAAAAVAAVDAG